MVNSKRMSKSKVAMIALAILLVLSLILTATGAWYTSTAHQDGGSHTLVLRNSFVSFEASSSASFVVTRDADGDSSTARTNVAGEGAGADKTYTVLPGDEVTVSGDVTFTVTNAGDVPFYYSIYKTIGSTKTRVVNVTRVASGHADIVKANVNELDNKELDHDNNNQTAAINGLVAGVAPVTYVVNTGLTTANMGQTVAIFTIGAYDIYAIQGENISSTDAQTELDTLAGYSA